MTKATSLEVTKYTLSWATDKVVTDSHGYDRHDQAIKKVSFQGLDDPTGSFQTKRSGKADTFLVE